MLYASSIGWQLLPKEFAVLGNCQTIMLDTPLLTDPFEAAAEKSLGVPRWLGIDYGQKRIGVALSYGSLAEPLQIVPNDPHAVAALQALAAEHRVTGLVFGLSEQAMAEETQQFAERVSAAAKLPLKFMDETLSSVEVQGKLAESRAGKRQHTGPIDHLAAAHILQAFLDEEALLE